MGQAKTLTERELKRVGSMPFGVELDFTPDA